jgi:hypothetical protein
MQIKKYVKPQSEVIRVSSKVCIQQGSKASGNQDYDPGNDEGDLAKRNNLWNTWED